MSIYWITFRIHYETIGGRSYEKRYDSLVAEIRGSATTYWEEPTSFFALESSHDIDSLAAAFKQQIAPSHDMFLMRDMDHKDARICGAVHDQNIFKLMPYLRKV
jgi:hypothetical protein